MKIKNFFVLIFTTLLFNSCLKKQDLENQDLGPEVSEEELSSKINESIGNINLNDILVGQKVKVITNITVEEATTYDISRTIHTLKNATPITENEEVVDIQIDTLQQHTNLRDSDQSYEKDVSYSLAKSVADLKVPAEPLIFWAMFWTRACSHEKVSCHNFSVTPKKIRLNPVSFDTLICPNSDICEIQVNEISFDQLNGFTLDSNGKPMRFHKTIIFAPKLPLFSRVMKYCDRYLDYFNGRNVLIEECHFVESADTVTQ